MDKNGVNYFGDIMVSTFIQQFHGLSYRDNHGMAAWYRQTVYYTP